MKRLVIITAAASVGVGGLAFAATGGPSTPVALSGAVSTVDWQKCPADNPNLASAECAQVQVPLDYKQPDGTKISVAVSRVKHTDTKHYQGVLVANPGGPGGSGLVMSVALAHWLPKKVAAKYDLIGFDPRGVGASQPALSCDPGYNKPVRPDYVPHSKAAEDAWVTRSAGYATACGTKFGWMLPFMRTTDAARDIDGIRGALGVKKISYYGFSYGTYLGATYGTMFPGNVKRMVLDGNVDVREVWYKGQLSQDVAFERNFGLFAGWVAKYNKVYHLGKTAKAVEASYYKVRAALKKKPINGEIGADELDDTALNAGYSTGWYEAIAAALSEYVVKHKSTILDSLYDPPTTDNDFAVYNAVQAADAPWPRDWKTWHNDAVATYKKARFETWGNVWFNAPIASWPIQGGPRFKVGTKKLPGFLLVQSTLDAATPYPGGVEMHKIMPTSRLIVEVGGKTHANTLNGNKCLDNKVAAYLDHGALPKSRKGPDAKCKALPDPDPTAPAAKSVSAPSGLDKLRLEIGRP